MGWLTQIIEPQASYAPSDDFWFRSADDSRGTHSGMPGGESAAMHVSAFFNGVKILAETVAQPPLILYERTADDTKEVANQTLLYSVLHDQPNSYQSSYEFRLLQTMSMLIGGNAYSQIVGGRRGAVDELRPLMCGRMRPKLLSNGRIGYMYRQSDSTETAFTQDEIFHVRAFPLSADGVTGQSLLTYARETTGASLATEAYGSRLFHGDSKRQGNFSVPGSLTPEQRIAYKALLKTEDHLVLEAGATWVDRGMTAQDAEFILSRKFSVNEWARWLNIPPHMLKDLDRATFSNIEHSGLEFLQYTMMPYFINWEQAILRDLIVQKNRFFAEFLVDGLVRADIATRYAAYASGINSGFMTRNQARAKENWNRIEGLDAPLVDQNKAVVDKSGKIIPVSGPPEPKPKPPTLREQEQAHYRQVLRGNAERVMRKEANALGRQWEKDKESPEKLRVWGEKFFAEQAQLLAEAMQIDGKRAQKFANDRRDLFALSVTDHCVRDHVHETEKYGAGELVAFVTENVESESFEDAA